MFERNVTNCTTHEAPKSIARDRLTVDEKIVLCVEGWSEGGGVIPRYETGCYDTTGNDVDGSRVEGNVCVSARV